MLAFLFLFANIVHIEDLFQNVLDGIYGQWACVSDYCKFSLLMLSVQAQATEHLKKKNQKSKKNFLFNKGAHCLASTLFTSGIKKQNARKLLEHHRLQPFTYQSWCPCQFSFCTWELIWQKNCGLSLDASLWCWNCGHPFVYISKHLPNQRR